jgi:protein containing AAA ATPase central region domain|nr:MAG TPA: replicative helicase [Caudoviricetes sp.]
MNDVLKLALQQAVHMTDLQPAAHRRSLFTGKEGVDPVGDLADLKQAVLYLGRKMCPSFTIDAHNLFAYTNAALWAAGRNEMRALDSKGTECQGDPTRGLLILGGVGTGKSFLVRLLYKLSIAIQTEHLIYDPMAQREVWKPFVWCDRHAIEYVSEYNAMGSIQNKNAPVICIQDLGVESEGSHFGKRQNVLGELITYRYDKQDATRRTSIITSNLTLSEIGDPARYGERVLSRLLEECNILQLAGPDRRRAPLL